MAKRQIKVQILPTGELKFDNSTNPDEKRILDELGELAELLTGEKTRFKVEQHVHKHGHGHEHTHDHQHVGGGS